MKRRLIAGVLLLALVSAAAFPASAQRAPGARPDISTDEGGLWDASDRAETEARNSGDYINDPALTEYVRQVTCKVAPTHCAELRLYLMQRPFFNAQMAPNGYGEVWSGLLLRASNEAELAFVLGHEATHFAENHSVENLRDLRARGNSMLIFSFALAAVGIPVEGAALGLLAGGFAFSRENEREADDLGFKALVAAGYDPGAAASIWQAQIDEALASDFERVRREPARASVFNSHPIQAERHDTLKAAAEGLPAGDTGAARYRAVIRPYLARWLRDDLRRRDFGQTLHLLDRLALGEEDLGTINFFRGEVYRLRRKDGDASLAGGAYLQAAAFPDAPPETWRELGESRRRAGNIEGARAAYQTYLEKAPTAEDAWLVEDTLKTLDRRPS